MYEKGFVLSSSGADGQEVSDSDDPIVQQMNNLRIFIKKAREANRYDDVSILEGNLRELQLEYQRCEQERQAESLAASAVGGHTASPTSLDSRNPFLDDEGDAGLQMVAAATRDTSSTGASSEATTSDELPIADKGCTSSTPGFSVCGRELATKPILNEVVASAFRNVKNNFPNKTLLTSLNPFTSADSEDEYDASGKNPFTE